MGDEVGALYLSSKSSDTGPLPAFRRRIGSLELIEMREVACATWILLL
jgi:hypothetical protein